MDPLTSNPFSVCEVGEDVAEILARGVLCSQPKYTLAD
jgi:hypothetical protein